jgi:hypothetical protein
MMGKVKTAILALIGAERDTSTNREEDPVTPEQFAALEKKVDALANAKPVETDQSALAKAIADAVTLAIKPVTDQVEAMANAAKAKDEAELVGLRAKIVKAGIMNQAEADALTTLAAARPVAKLAEPGHAFALSNGFGGGNPAGDFDLPEGEA